MNERILQEINYRIDEALEYGRRWVEDEEINERLEDIKNDAEHFIRRNPVKGLAAGLFVGYLVGKIFSSRD